MKNTHDEFEQFMIDINAASDSPSKQFKDGLHRKIKNHFYGPAWLTSLMELFSNRIFLTGAGSLAVILIAFSFLNVGPNTIPTIKPPKVAKMPTFAQKRDDWIFKYTGEVAMGPQGGGGFSLPNMFNKSSSLQMGAAVSEMNIASDANLGFSTGGAKDINNFRENIKNGYLPLPTDITYEGLFYDYFFDTGKQKECNQLFCPSYSYAISKDPFSNQNEYYMTVGLNSGIKQSDFRRKNLNLIVVLDISGSMGSPFDEYYYDKNKNGEFKDTQEELTKKKMQVANEALVAMLNHLQPQDRLGIVLFDGSAYEAKPLNYVGETKMEEIKKHILEIQEQGSTNHEAGFTKGLEVFDDARLLENHDYENRIIFITDAMPNTGSTDKNSLLGLVNQAEQKKIYTTFIGVGIDFNSELIEQISKVHGANYYSVHSSFEFKNRMDTEFEYMVTPLVFDLSLDFKSDGWEIEKVYGSPDVDSTQGNLMYVRTLFPSASTGGETKGGIVLLKLRNRGRNNQDIRLTASYTDRSGSKYQTAETVVYPTGTNEYYPHAGIRKAIVLTRYANLMKNFILTKQSPTVYTDRYETLRSEGIIPPDDIPFSQWERTSIELSLTAEDRSIFEQFKRYFESEQRSLNDNTLDQEKEILNILSR